MDFFGGNQVRIRWMQGDVGGCRLMLVDVKLCK